MVCQYRSDFVVPNQVGFIIIMIFLDENQLYLHKSREGPNFFKQLVIIRILFLNHKNADIFIDDEHWLFWGHQLCNATQNTTLYCTRLKNGTLVREMLKGCFDFTRCPIYPKIRSLPLWLWLCLQGQYQSCRKISCSSCTSLLAACWWYCLIMIMTLFVHNYQFSS